MSASPKLILAASICALVLISASAFLWWKDQQKLHEEVHRKLLGMANESNKGTPKMVDNNTRLDNVAVTDLQFRYNYTLVNSANDVNFADIEKKLKPIFADRLCGIAGWRNDFLSNGVLVEYSYRDKEGRRIGNISISQADCK